MRISILLILLTFTGLANAQKAFVALGYTMSNSSISKAYYPHYSYHPVPADLTTVDFSKDNFLVGNWHFKMGWLSEDLYFDSDLSFLGQTFVTSVYEWGANKNIKPQHQVGVGKLRKLKKNFETVAVSEITSDFFGIDANLWSMEIAFGKRFLVGGYFGTSALGLDSDIAFGNTGGTQSVGFTPHNYIYGNLGLGLHYVFDDNIAIFSLRGERLRVWKNSHDLDYKRTGFEIYPSLRAFIGGGAGIYLDLYYKYRYFGKKTVTDHWSDDADGTSEGTLVGFSSATFGITLGIYVPYFAEN